MQDLSKLVPISDVWLIAMDRELKDPAKQAGAAKLAQLFPTMKRFDATDAARGDAITVPIARRTQLNLIRKTQDSYMDITTRGAVACADSHVRVLRHAASSPETGGWTLVLETDAVVNPTALATLASEEAPVTPDDDVSLITLGPSSSFKRLATEEIPGRKRLKRVVREFITGSHAYLVRNRDAARILDAILPLEIHIDNALATAAYLGLIPPMWIASPAVGTQQSIFRTTIHTAFSIKGMLPSENAKLLPLLIVPYVLSVLLLVGLVIAAVFAVKYRRKLQ